MAAKSEIVFEESTTARQEEPGKQAVFAFVNATGPIARDAGVQRSIRKHVMRDIGKSRRKDTKSRSPDSKPNSPPQSTPTTIVVEASPDFWNSVQLVRRTKRALNCADPSCDAVTHACVSSHDDCSNSEKESEVMFCDDHLPAVNAQNETAPQMDRFSGGRIDPFIQYPIEMSRGVRKLVDHGERGCFITAPSFPYLQILLLEGTDLT